MNPVIVNGIFSNERLLEITNYFNELVSRSGIQKDKRTIFDSINNPILKMLGQELLPIAKNVFNNNNIYSIKTTFAHYEGNQGVLKRHIDKQEDVLLLDICIYENVPWGIVIDNKNYYFSINSAVAFESGKLEHWRNPNPDPVNNKTGVLLAYFEPSPLNIYTKPIGE